MKAKTLISLCLFLIVLGVGGLGGVSLLLYLCDQLDAIAGIREKTAGAVLGAVALVVIVAGFEKLLGYAARKYAANKTTAKPKSYEHGNGD